MKARPRLRVLGPSDLHAVRHLIAQDPVTNVFVDYRVRLTGMEPRWLGGEIWGYEEGRELVSLCHVAANLTPVQTTSAALDAFAFRALEQGRRCGSIMGLHEDVAALWRVLGPRWGPPRSVRSHQPFLVLSRTPRVEASAQVRRVRLDELDILYPACVSMYTEELGVSPEAGGGAALYRARIAQLINKGLAFAHIANGHVVFKAEIGAVTPHAAQLQSVWVAPPYRSQGLAAGGVAAVCEAALQDLAPVVSLYVNAHNEPARRTYARVGFEETCRFATILF